MDPNGIPGGAKEHGELRQGIGTQRRLCWGCNCRVPLSRGGANILLSRAQSQTTGGSRLSCTHVFTLDVHVIVADLLSVCNQGMCTLDVHVIEVCLRYNILFSTL